MRPICGALPLAELRDQLQRHGFRIARALGITPMPYSLETREFDYREMVRNKRLSDDPEIAYCFYLDAVKP